MTMGYIAPAGTRLSLGDIALGLTSGWMRRDAEARLCAALCRLGTSARAWPLVSGRAAMTVALKAMARQSGTGRKHVIIPAYTCYSVPAAVERAGLVPVPCDIDTRSLSFDFRHLEQLAGGDALAIVTANLFGIPNALPEIEAIARQRGIWLLDDAAQAMGARIGGRPVGGFGELGLYSFDKGKNISTMQGGALVARDGALLAAAEAECRGLARSRPGDTAVTVAKLPPYAVLLRPSGYALVRRLPLLRLGETCYETEYPVTRLSRGLAGLALRQLARLPDYQAARVANAAALRSALDELPGLAFIEPPAGAEPAYPRFPLRVSQPGLRDKLLHALDHAGIGASGFYPQALPDVSAVARRMPQTSHPFAGAREVARTIMTLPTHAYSPRGLAGRVREIVLAASSG